MPKISVIIPVYNVEKYLRECLDSVRAQTFMDWECICVDDGSTDSSPAILDEYAGKDSRFTIIKREHSNAGACRNAGLDVAKGEYLSFLDSDDVFSPKMLEIMYDAAKRSNADIASCDFANWNEGECLPKLDRKCSIFQQHIFDFPRKNVDVFSLWGGMAWDKLFNKSFIDSLGIQFQEIQWTNDFRFVMLAVSFAKRIVKCQSRLLAYRKGHVSLQTTRSNKALCFYEALGSYRDMAIDAGLFTPGSLLERNFKRFFVRFTFHHMDTIETSAAYEEVHRRCQELCSEWEVADLLENDFEEWEQERNVFLRFQKIIGGCTPLESARFHELLILKEVVRLRPLEYIENSKDFRLGHLLLYFPRKAKAFLRVAFWPIVFIGRTIRNRIAKKHKSQYGCIVNRCKA